MLRVHYGNGNPSYGMLLIWLLWWFHGAMLSLPTSKPRVARGRFFELASSPDYIARGERDWPGDLESIRVSLDLIQVQSRFDRNSLALL